MTRAPELLLSELSARLRGRRVAYVCADPGIGVFGTKGASVHVQAVVRTMRRAGARVEVFAVKTGGSPPPDLTDLPVHLLPVDTRHRDGAGRERALVEADTRLGAVLHAAGPFDMYYERYSLFSGRGAQWAAETGLPVIVEVNAPLIDEQARHRHLAHPAEAAASLHRLMGAADLAVCVSEPVRAWLTGRTRVRRAVVVPNGADVHRVRPRAAAFPGGAPGTAGDGPGTPTAHRPPTIGFVGTLKPWHGVEVLLEAAAPLLRGEPDGPGARLLVVGDGPQAADLDIRARELGITAGVHRTGAVHPGRVPGLLQQMDLAVAPYPRDAGTYFSPLKVLEYLAAGLPVVASAVGQLPDLVAHGRTGLLVPASDPTALRRALVELLHDPHRRRRMGTAARAQAVARHSWEHTLARTLRALEGGVQAA